VAAGRFESRDMHAPKGCGKCVWGALFTGLTDELDLTQGRQES